MKRFLLLACAVALLGGAAIACSDASTAMPEPTEKAGDSGNADALAEMEAASVTFRLENAPGQQQTVTRSEATILSLDNCQGGQAITQCQMLETPTITPTLPELRTEDLDLTPYRSVVAAVLREAYADYDQAWPQEQQACLSVPAGESQQASYAWETTWDRNVLLVMDGQGQRLASLPVSRTLDLALICAEKQSRDCPPPTLSIDSAQREAAIDLLKRYLAYLDRGEIDTAYTLLTDDYRKRMPYERYGMGYEPVTAIALDAISGVSAGNNCVFIQARLSITLEDGPQGTQTWIGEYRMMQDEDDALAIGSAVMYPSRLIAPTP